MESADCVSLFWLPTLPTTKNSTSSPAFCQGIVLNVRYQYIEEDFLECVKTTTTTTTTTTMKMMTTTTMTTMTTMTTTMTMTMTMKAAPNPFILFLVLTPWSIIDQAEAQLEPGGNVSASRRKLLKRVQSIPTGQDLRPNDYVHYTRMNRMNLNVMA